MSSDSDDIPIRPRRSLTTSSRLPGANAQGGQVGPAQQRIQTGSSSGLEAESEDVDLAEAQASPDSDSEPTQGEQENTRSAKALEEESDADSTNQESEMNQTEADSQESEISQDEADSQEDEIVAEPETQHVYPVFRPVTRKQASGGSAPAAPNTFQQELEKGFHFLAEYVREQDLRRIKAKEVKNMDSAAWIKHCVSILASTPTPILAEIMGGNLAKAKIEDRNGIAKILRPHEERLNLSNGKDAPAIYHILLVDKDGNSPSANELTQVIKVLRKYPNKGEWELANKIDQMVGSDAKNRFTTDTAKQGRRRYLCDLDEYKVKEHRVQNLEEFCDALERRIQNIPQADRDKPLEAPLRYFGYGDAFTRTKCHLTHKSSNYIMGLVDAVLSEILFTAIGDGYIDDGGGFSHEPAGSNNWSGQKTTDRQWERAAKWTLKHTPYIQNLELHRKVLEKEANLPQKIAELKADTANLEEQEQETWDELEPQLISRVQDTVEASRTVTGEVNNFVDLWDKLLEETLGHESEESDE
ncbi:LisH domain-containing protein [Lasiodiplodia theobromae]|uniref:LisH domain-containing protein n=1 Tax=Lasiodiplodia theobromae TaxID=45133 RepID=A0A5N5DPB9_9PEZI|nr:LisH domain-containing protein [Lasiodiplodia theobromae]